MAITIITNKQPPLILPVGLHNNQVHQLPPQEEVKNFKNINAHTSTNNII